MQKQWHMHVLRAALTAGGRGMGWNFSIVVAARARCALDN